MRLDFCRAFDPPPHGKSQMKVEKLRISTRIVGEGLAKAETAVSFWKVAPVWRREVVAELLREQIVERSFRTRVFVTALAQKVRGENFHKTLLGFVKAAKIWDAVREKPGSLGGWNKRNEAEFGEGRCGAD